MAELSHHTDLMHSVIRASKEIILLKQALSELHKARVRLERTHISLNGLEKLDTEITVRIKTAKFYIAGKMESITKNIPFFPEITHFTQKELDQGYAITEQATSDQPEKFDEDGDFMPIFVKYAIILHNGKIIPYVDVNSKIIINQAKPV